MSKVYHVVTLISDNDQIEIETSSQYDIYSAQELARFALILMKDQYKMTKEEVDKFDRFKLRRGRKG